MPVEAMAITPGSIVRTPRSTRLRTRFFPTFFRILDVWEEFRQDKMVDSLDGSKFAVREPCCSSTLHNAFLVRRDQRLGQG